MDMATEDLNEMIASLSDAERKAVAEFVKFLKEGKKPSNTLLSAIHEFAKQHPELLRRLAR